MDMPGCHVGTEGLESGPCASTASDLTHCALPTTHDLCALKGRNMSLLHSNKDPEPGWEEGTGILELSELKEVEVRVLRKGWGGGLRQQQEQRTHSRRKAHRSSR